MALGALLTVLSVVTALGGGGAAFAFCGLPAVLAAAFVWLAVQNRKAGSDAGEVASGEWTVDAEPAPTATRTGEAVPAGRFPAAERSSPPIRTAPQPTRRSATRAARVQERPPRSPAEYRQRAVSYRRKIQSLIKNRRPGPIAERMSGVLQKLTSWEERVGQLADRLTLYEGDELIQRDVREVPGHIARLERQLSLEAEPEMQKQIRRTLSAYEEQERQLELLARVMKRTRLNLDDTLAAMGTVYSQLQVLNAMDLDGATAARIADDVDREVERLNDLLAAMSDVYGSSAEPAPQPAADIPDEDAGMAGRKSRLGGSAGK
ncbi:MAG TPA: hypothetical protein PLP66_15645 [Phycisphaerae bacterium]|nr:hypothetical protein [Phycisphaerae bacterium]